MKDQLLKSLKEAVTPLGVNASSVRLEYPEDPSHGDFSTNVAMANAKALKISPKALADKIIVEFEKERPDFIEKAEVAGPGFINFTIKDEALARAAIQVADAKKPKPSGKKVMVEYTDPNPFKEFHIGHLMSNAIGESISRLTESSGAKVIRANWQGDVGPHVAKAIWGAMHSEGKKEMDEAFWWGLAYADGAKAYDSDEKAKKEIDEINKNVYSRDPSVMDLYNKGREVSLKAFKGMYKKLDTKFDNYFFEGTEGRNGEGIVKKNIKAGVFEESEGAVVFKGEKYGLHTRVFITSHGLPTYETKELGLNAEKFKLYPDLAESVIITANEQSDYFKVLLKVMSLIMPEIATKTKHISHGLMRFASGKMSSRKGNVISAEELVNEIRGLAWDRLNSREDKSGDLYEIADQIAIGAIKYTILRQAIGGDVIFDSAKSISFEGDSGPYLQYSAVRANSVLEKAGKQKGQSITDLPEKVGLLEKLIIRFPDIVDRARDEYAPQLVANYLTALASAFNAFYAGNTIVDSKEPLSPYRIALTESFLKTMADGLRLLGIKVPKKM